MKKAEVEKNMNKFYDFMDKYAKENGHAFERYKPVAVGYLDITEEYRKGPVSQNFINKLRMIWDSGGCSMSMGHHDCEFCEGEDKAKSSCEKILRDKENKIEYKFPEMIFHYIEEHDYQPPEDFVLFILNWKGK